MQNSSTFSILFWIYASRAKNNESKIYVRITINGKRTNMNLNRSVDISLWDSSRQKVKGNSKNARQINNYLGLVHSRIFTTLKDDTTDNKRVVK